MPWTADNTIDSIKNKSLAVRKLFAEVANTALDKGRTEEEAIYAGLAAVRNKERKSTVKKAIAEPVPLHLKALLEAKKQQEIQKDAFGNSYSESITEIQKGRLPSGTQRSIIDAQFDDSGRLVLTFDTGEVITTRSVEDIKVSTSIITAGGSGSGGSSATYQTHLDDTDPDDMYWGESEVGTLDSAAGWKIKRIQISGQTITQTWADGNQNYDNIWDNRLSLSYS